MNPDSAPPAIRHAAVQWPTPKGAMEAYDFVQDPRAAAKKLWEKKEFHRNRHAASDAVVLDHPKIEKAKIVEGAGVLLRAITKFSPTVTSIRRKMN